MKSRRTSETRNQYLINYRNGLWTQIRSKEESVWRFISYYSAALLLALNFGLGSTDFTNTSARIKLITILIVFVLVSFWGLFITLDSNYWFQRNLIIIRNIERIILNKRDFGWIIPKSFAEHFQKYNYTTFTRIQNVFFSVLIIFTVFVIIFFSHNQTDPTLQILAHLSCIIFSTLLLLVINKNMEYVVRLFCDQESAPGTFFKTDSEVISRDSFVNATIENSNLETCFSFMTIIGFAGYGFIFLNNKEIVSEFLSISAVRGIITTLVFFITLIVAFLFYLKEKNTSTFLRAQVKLSVKIKYFLRSFAIITICVCGCFMLAIRIINYPTF